MKSPYSVQARSKRKLGTLAALLVSAATALLPLSVRADYPDRTIHVVYPYAAGGAGDMLTREFMAGLESEFHVPVIVDFKPGAGTLIAANFVAKSAPDGYNLLINGPASHVIMPLINPKIPYNAEKDFELIGMWAIVGNMITVNPSVPVKTLKELVEYSRNNPGKLNYSSAGIGTGPHLGGETFKEMTKADLTHVAYKGAAPATMALVAGEVQVSFVNIPPQVPFIKNGRIRPIAVSTSERSSLLPDVPTAAEAGLPGYLSESWFGVAVPAGTPADVRAKLQNAMFKAGADPERKARLAAAGVEIKLLGPKEFADYIKSEVQRVGPVIKKIGLKIE